MGNFISSIGSGIVTLFKDLWLLITNVDELFFNYTSASIPLFFVFLMGKFIPSVFGMMFKKKQPSQMGRPGQFIGPQPQFVPQQQFMPQQQFIPQQPMMRGGGLEKPNYFIIVLVLMIVYYFDTAEDCRDQGKGTLDKQQFIFNGLWTFGSVAVVMFIMNMTILRMFNQVMGGGIIDSIFKGAIFYFVYNFIRNFRDITKRNKCSAPEKTDADKKDDDKKDADKKDDDKKDDDKKEGFAPIDYNLFNIKKLTDKMQGKIQNGKITREDFTEVFDAIKKVDDLNPKDLLKASNEVKKVVKKPINSAKNIKKVKTQRQEELKDSLPLERRLPKGPEPVGIENNAQHMLTPLESEKKSKRSKSIEDKVIRDDSGRILGLNF